MATYDDVVELTADLPMTATRQWYGTPGVGVNGKGFCRMWREREYRRDGVCFETPHYEGHGGYLVRLADVEVDELRDLLEEAYRTKAPAAALEELDTRS